MISFEIFLGGNIGVKIPMDDLGFENERKRDKGYIIITDAELIPFFEKRRRRRNRMNERISSECFWLYILLTPRQTSGKKIRSAQTDKPEQTRVLT